MRPSVSTCSHCRGCRSAAPAQDWGHRHRLPSPGGLFPQILTLDYLEMLAHYEMLHHVAAALAMMPVLAVSPASAPGLCPLAAQTLPPVEYPPDYGVNDGFCAFDPCV